MAHNISIPSLIGNAVFDATKPTLLYFSPTLPAPCGNGSSVRADLQTEALSRTFNIFIFVFHKYGTIDFCGDLDALRSRCLGIEILPRETDYGTLLSQISKMRAVHVDVVFIFRLGMINCAKYFLGSVPNQPRVVLDFDDFESDKGLSFAQHFESLGDAPKARAWRQYASRMALAESEAMSRIDCLYVANPKDKEKLLAEHGCGRVEILPNAVRMPRLQLRRYSDDAPISIIFVGTMQYFPNWDAAIYFCDAILPEILAQTRRLVHVTIVGSRPPNAVVQLQEREHVTVTGAVPSLQPYYKAATMAVVPLRVASGTRIKILEACSHCVPVVSTSIGAEGLDLRDGLEIFIADTPEAFARCCLKIAEDPKLAADLGQRGRARVKKHYTINAVQTTLDATILPLIAPAGPSESKKAAQLRI
jgi:glycosyltransferase involved in cell wall biosynthesis